MTLGPSPRSCDPFAGQHKRDDGPRPQSDPPPQRGTMEASRPESAAARLERERDFHNARFEHDARDAQLKYYDAIADCFRDYWARVNQLAAGADILEYGCAYGDNAMRPIGRASCRERVFQYG